MKLYNNSQKTPHGESLHKVKQSCKTLCQKKMKVYTANITVSSSPPPASNMAGENTPNSSTRLQRKVSTHKILKLIHTKATRIVLQHQILILYTALLPKGRCGFVSAAARRQSGHTESSRLRVRLRGQEISGGAAAPCCRWWLWTIGQARRCCTFLNLPAIDSV